MLWLIDLITVFDIILTSRQDRRRGYEFPYTLCKHFANEADASDIDIISFLLKLQTWAYRTFQVSKFAHSV